MILHRKIDVHQTFRVCECIGVPWPLLYMSRCAYCFFASSPFCLYGAHFLNSQLFMWTYYVHIRHTRALSTKNRKEHFFFRPKTINWAYFCFPFIKFNFAFSLILSWMMKRTLNTNLMSSITVMIHDDKSLHLIYTL